MMRATSYSSVVCELAMASPRARGQSAILALIGGTVVPAVGAFRHAG